MVCSVRSLFLDPLTYIYIIYIYNIYSYHSNKYSRHKRIPEDNTIDAASLPAMFSVRQIYVPSLEEPKFAIESVLSPCSVVKL